MDDLEHRRPASGLDDQYRQRFQSQQPLLAGGLSCVQQIQTVLDQIENTVSELRLLNKVKSSKDLFGHETCTILCTDPLIVERRIVDRVLSQSETIEALMVSLANSKQASSSRSKYKMLNGSLSSSSSSRRRSSSTESSDDKNINCISLNQRHHQTHNHHPVQPDRLSDHDDLAQQLSDHDDLTQQLSDNDDLAQVSDHDELAQQQRMAHLNNQIMAAQSPPDLNGRRTSGSVYDSENGYNNLMARLTAAAAANVSDQQHPPRPSYQQQELFTRLNQPAAAVAAATANQHRHLLSGDRQQSKMIHSDPQTLCARPDGSAQVPYQQQQFGSLTAAELAQYQQQAMIIQQHLFLSQLAIGGRSVDDAVAATNGQGDNNTQQRNEINSLRSSRARNHHALIPFSQHNELLSMQTASQLNHHLPQQAPNSAYPSPAATSSSSTVAAAAAAFAAAVMIEQQHLHHHGQQQNSALNALMLARNLASSMGVAGGGLLGPGGVFPMPPTSSSLIMSPTGPQSLLSSGTKHEPTAIGGASKQVGGSMFPNQKHHHQLNFMISEQLQQQQQHQQQQQQQNTTAMSFIHHAAKQHLQLRLAAAASAASVAPADNS